VEFEVEEKNVADDEIDFGDETVDTDFVDETEIDFGDELKIEVIEDENGSEAVVDALEDENNGIAKYDTAFSIFESHETFLQLTADLEEVRIEIIYLTRARARDAFSS